MADDLPWYASSCQDDKKRDRQDHCKKANVDFLVARDDGFDFEDRGMLDGLFHGAGAGRVGHGSAVFFRKAGGHFDFHDDLVNASSGPRCEFLNHANAFGGDVALLAKRQDIETRASAQGGEKHQKGARRAALAAACHGLIRFELETTEVRIDPKTPWKTDDHVVAVVVHESFSF
jgi:hypothetical protein